MSLSREQTESIEPILRSIKIISFALVAGVLIAAIIFCSIVDWQQANSEFGLMALVGLAAAGLAVGQALVLPKLIIDTAVRSIEEKDPETKIPKLASLLQTRTIIQLALIEGAAFLNLILFFLTVNLLLLAMVAVCLAMMAITLPSTDSSLAWIAEQMDY